MPKSAHNPSEVRQVFGENLGLLTRRFKSVSEVCRELGVNRTQFNRYLSGESFPRPDVLQRICSFFEVDARILLEPLGALQHGYGDLINHPMLEGFFGRTTVDVSEDLFPSGFYRFARRSFLDGEKFVLGIVLIKRADGYTFLRGFEPRSALKQKGLSTKTYTAEFRGIVMRQEEGVMAVVAKRDSMSSSFNFLAQDTSFQSNIWEGYASRTVREKVSGRRAMRMVYEHLGTSCRSVLDIARQTGVVSIEQVPEYYVHLLRPSEEFR
ncbi:MAG: helix-turn-helix transcriptional regulator [Pseudomonadota bacterium]